MATIIYGLWECEDYTAATQCWGDILFTCDTMVQVQDYVKGEQFQKALDVVHINEWEVVNNGDKCQAIVAKKLYAETYERYFVIAQLPHNPTAEDRF